MPDPARIQDSVLHDIKQMLGQEWDDPTYDVDIKIHINTVFGILHQIGASPLEGFTISDETATWPMFIQDVANVEMIKSYIYMQVRMMFDAPTTGPLMNSMQAQIDRLEWRLSIMEVKFNPYAYSGLNLGNVWIIDEASDFPPEAPIGALGFDPDTGKIWRNT